MGGDPESDITHVKDVTHTTNNVFRQEADVGGGDECCGNVESWV